MSMLCSSIFLPWNSHVEKWLLTVTGQLKCWCPFSITVACNCPPYLFTSASVEFENIPKQADRNKKINIKFHYLLESSFIILHHASRYFTILHDFSPCFTMILHPLPSLRYPSRSIIVVHIPSLCSTILHHNPLSFMILYASCYVMLLCSIPIVILFLGNISQNGFRYGSDAS